MEVVKKKKGGRRGGGEQWCMEIIIGPPSSLPSPLPLFPYTQIFFYSFFLYSHFMREGFIKCETDSSIFFFCFIVEDYLLSILRNYLSTQQHDKVES